MFNSIPSADIAVKKPVKQSLMQNIKDNDDYLYGAIGTLGATNIKNGSFEIDSDSDGVPDNWTRALYQNGSGGFYTTSPQHGAQAYYFTRTSGPGNGGGYLKSDYFEISPLRPYVLGVTLWATAAGMRNKVFARYYDKDKVIISSETLYNSTSNPTSATRYYWELTIPSTAMFIKVEVLGGYTDADVAGTAYFEDVMLYIQTITDLIKDAAVTQAKLKTSTWNKSEFFNSGQSNNWPITGGTYAFHVSVKCDGAGDEYEAHFALAATNTSYASYLGVKNTGAGSTTISGQAIYVTSSGEVFWVFILRDKNSKDIIGVSMAPDHPCFGNGGDPDGLPHPFLKYNPAQHEIVVITGEMVEGRYPAWVEDIYDRAEKGDGDPTAVLKRDYEIDEASAPPWPTKPVTVGIKGTLLRPPQPGQVRNVIKREIPERPELIHRTLKLK